jgi:SHS2 domain-containing protein
LKEKGYRLIDHTADFGLEIWAPDQEALFSHTALILFQTMVDGAAVVKMHSRILTIEGDDWSDLMVNWLRELLYIWHGDGQVLADVSIQAIDETHLLANITTDDFRPRLHAVQHDIKAVTYHQVQVGPCGKGWCARLIFDV